MLLSHYGPIHARELLGAAQRALVPGGFLLFDFLNETARGQWQHVPDAKAYFAPQEVSALAQAAGLKEAVVLGGPDRRVRWLYGRK